MSAPATNVPIEHNRVVHQVRTTQSSAPKRPFAAPPAQSNPSTSTHRTAPGQYTLLELVEAISEVADDDREIVATVVHLLASGQVRLCGNFRDEPVEMFLAG